MFENIGGKIKACAITLTVVGILGSIIVGLIYMTNNMGSPRLFLGFVIWIVGGLSSWIGSFLLYGFGQLIENSDIMVEGMTMLLEEKKYESEFESEDCNAQNN